MKKEKLTINSLAMGNLKRRKKQYAIMIVGIILAMIFSSSTLFFMFSSNETYKAKQQERLGKQNAIFCAYDGDSETAIKNSVERGFVADYGLAHVIGLGYTDSQNLGTGIGWLDDKAMKLSNISFIEGSYPVNENEIAIERTALLKLGIEAKLGAEITLQVRTQNGGRLLEAEPKTYTLVGIVSDKKSNIFSDTSLDEGYDFAVPSAFVAQNTQTELGGKEFLTAYLDLSHVYDPNFHLFLDEQISNNNYGMLYNKTYRSLGYFTGISDDGRYIAVIAVVLIIASCTAIVNSFNTNIKERKKQIGMLRAVGATKRQIVKIFGREALIISLICTPISIAVSYFLVWGLITLINDEAVMTKSIASIPLIAAVCIAVTMLAAMIPLIFASMITPMQAIRNIDISRKMKLKKIKSQKQFEVSSHLAKRNSKLYIGSKLSVSILLTAAIIISCFGFSGIHYTANIDASWDYDYELWNLSSYSGSFYYNFNLNGMSESDKRMIEDYPYFSSTFSTKSLQAILEVDELTGYHTSFLYGLFGDDVYGINMDNENYAVYKNRYGNGKDIVYLAINSYDERAIEGLEDRLTAGKIDYEKLASGEEIILVAPQSVNFSVYVNENSNFIAGAFYDGEEIGEEYKTVSEGECPYKVGDKMKISVVEYKSRDDAENAPDSYSRVDREVTIGAIIKPTALDKLMNTGGFSIITSHSGMYHFSENAKYESIVMYVGNHLKIDGDIDTEITEFLQDFADKYEGHSFSNYTRIQEHRDDIIKQLVSMLSIIILGFVICASIINNSLTASIREKKKEIGTLRAVGADIGVLVKSYIIQLLSMLGIGYGLGFGGFCVAYVGRYLYLKYVAPKYSFLTLDDFKYVFSPWETLAFCVLLFAICSINLWSKVRKEMKNSIVENIKEL